MLLYIENVTKNRYKLKIVVKNRWFPIKDGICLEIDQGLN